MSKSIIIAKDPERNRHRIWDDWRETDDSWEWSEIVFITKNYHSMSAIK